MSFTSPTPGPSAADSESSRPSVPGATSAYAVQPPPGLGAPASRPGYPSGPGTGGPEGSAGPGSRPSWVAWVALALSTLTFFIAATTAAFYAVDRLSDDAPVASEGPVYDAGLPSWSAVELAPSGAATERALTDSVEEALRVGLEDFEGKPDDVHDVYCAALPAPRKDSVATCSADVQDVDSTVVLFFLDDKGSFMATLY